MLIKPLHRHGYRSVGVVALVLMSLVPATVAQQQGQYRSRILLTPGSELDKGAELSIEELEQQIGSIEQPYAKSSAGRHLARHYVEQGEYAKAIEFYQTALTAQGLSSIANREMLRELSQVYLLSEDYAAAAQTLQRALDIDLVPEVTDYLLLAQAHYKMGKYVAVVAALDQIQEKGLTLDTRQTRQALALYYRAGAYAQCERLLRRLLQLEPDNPDNWHQLASVYLQQNKKRQALDQLTLAREKAVPFTERDIILLADLHAANDNPYGAGQVLDEALAQQQVASDGEHYRKLFQFWLRAREHEKAAQALSRAAKLSGDTELYLYLAQLQMEKRAWPLMHQTMLEACAEPIRDKFVGRANLLLGVSQLKLGDNVSARRSFINATLIGGVNAQAAQWLNFMNAEATTKNEARRIVGICFGSEGKRGKGGATAFAVADEQATAESAGQSEIQTKTVPAMRLFYTEQDMTLSELGDKLQSLVVRMNINLVKAGGTVTGPVHLIPASDFTTQEATLAFQLALPMRGSPSARGKNKVRSTDSFKCGYLQYAGPPDGL
ncbi:MAG: tetratricopeptide repeat protein, partial [Halioglobus sp.]